MTEILTTLVLVTSGVLAGGLVLVAAALIPTFRALSPGSSIQLHQTIDRYINRYIAPDTALTVVLAGVLIVLGDGTSTRLLLGTGALLCLAVTVISVTRNVPLNRTVRSWTTEAPASDVRTLQARWARSHLARTVAGVLALVAFASAAVGV